MSTQPVTGRRPATLVSPDQDLEDFKPRIAPSPDPRRSRSLEYGVAILESFSADHPALRISELADIVGISRSTTHRYATTLVELGCLEQDSKRRYRLAHNAARAGMAAVNTVRLESPARAILEDLRNQTGHTVSMGLLDGSRAIYIHRLHSHRAGQYEADRDLGVGAHVPVHSSAIGKALLANLLDSELRSPLLSMCSNGAEPDTVPVEMSLVNEIEQVRKDGIAASEDHSAGARSIAAPVIRWLDKPILAVKLTVPASAYTMDELLARFGEAVRHTAKLLSA